MFANDLLYSTAGRLDKIHFIEMKNWVEAWIMASITNESTDQNGLCQQLYYLPLHLLQAPKLEEMI